MTPEVSIVSVSYNSAAVFLKDWKSFLESTSFEVIFVDNASPDGSGVQLSRSFSRPRVIQLDKNIGYGRAANVGINECRGRLALLVNPDLHITNQCFLI